MKFPEFDELGNMIGQGFDSGAQVLNNPGVQGLLAAGLGAASQVGKRNVGPLNTLGAAGLAGLGAYGLGRNVNSRNEYNKARIKALTQKQVMEADALKRGQTWLETNNKLEQEGIPIKQKMNEYNTQLINTPYSTPTPTQVPYELGEQDTYSSALGKAKDQRVVLDEYNQRKDQHLSSMDNPNLADFLKQKQTPLTTSEAGMPQAEKLNNAISRLNPTDPNYRQNKKRLLDALRQTTGQNFDKPMRDEVIDTVSGIQVYNHKTKKWELQYNDDGSVKRKSTTDPTRQGDIARFREGSKLFGAAAMTSWTDLPKVTRTVTRNIRNLRSMLKDPAFESSVGFTWRPGAKYLPGTPEKAFQEKVRQFLDVAFLQAFQELKGGGGQISDAEGSKAANAKARLDTDLGEEDFKEAIYDYITVLDEGLTTMEEKAEMVDERQLGVSPDKARRFQKTTSLGGVDTHAAPAAAKEKALELPANPNALTLKKGVVYQTPNGQFRWDGKNFEDVE